MSLDVLTPVQRRRRRRGPYRMLKFVVLALLVAGAVAAGAILGWSRAPAGRHLAPPAGTQRPPTTQAVTTKHARSVPLRLLKGPALLAGRPVRLLAPAAILVEADTGRVLWQKRPHERRAIASLTKIMTATLALKTVPWHRVLTVDRRATRVALVKEGLRTGEHVPAWKIFYAALLYSGNDDATQLAISSAGSVRAFLRQMNREARRLGLHNTHFTSPSGVIDRGNFSTPWDVAALTRYALRNPRFRTLVRRKEIRVGWAPPTNWKIYVNNNRLLQEYRGANGVKTGYTAASGWCLSAAATRHGRTLIAVVLDSEDIYADAATLLDLGFDYEASSQ